jgi:hypothetical protein
MCRARDRTAARLQEQIREPRLAIADRAAVHLEHVAKADVAHARGIALVLAEVGCCRVQQGLDGRAFLLIVGAGATLSTMASRQASRVDTRAMGSSGAWQSDASTLAAVTRRPGRPRVPSSRRSARRYCDGMRTTIANLEHRAMPRL